MKILSTGVRKHLLAGTKHPICANITAKHVCLNKVDFPPILGPVTNKINGFYPLPLMQVSLGINFFSFFLKLC